MHKCKEEKKKMKTSGLFGMEKEREEALREYLKEEGYSKEVIEAEIRIDGIRKQREEIETYERDVKELKERHGVLHPI